MGGVRGAHPRCDRAVDADSRLLLQESHAPGLGVLPRPARIHHGRLYCPGPVGGRTAQCVWLCVPLDRCVERVRYEHY